jgi:hypothetical protein
VLLLAMESCHPSILMRKEETGTRLGEGRRRCSRRLFFPLSFFHSPSLKTTSCSYYFLSIVTIITTCLKGVCRAN